MVKRTQVKQTQLSERRKGKKKRKKLTRPTTQVHQICQLWELVLEQQLVAGLELVP